MKTVLSQLLRVGVFTAWFACPTFAAEPSSGQIDFGTFTPPASGGEFVEVHIRSNLIAMAARLAEKAEPEVAELIRGLQLIRVNVISLDEQNRGEVEARVKAVRGQLDAQGWERIVVAQSQKEDVGVYVKTRGDEAIEGVVVTVIEGNQEAVFVNVVGNLQPEKLATLGERFDLEPLKKLNLPPKTAATK